MSNPPHPGDFIRTEILAGFSIDAPAAKLSVSGEELANLVEGSADLSDEMARRIEKTFGVRAATLRGGIERK